MTEVLGIEGLEDVEVAGQGGFAVVYKAQQPAFRRTVAVKVLSAHLDEAANQRFDRECQVMGSLSEHPSIVTIFDAGRVADGKPYLLMAFMPGGSLQDRLDDGPMRWQDAVPICVRMAGALEVAHQSEVVHRDVKPDNILLSSFGEPQLTDFGIARVAGGHETRSGIVSASLAYAPPEVIDGQRPSVAGDVYSLGSTLYTLLAGTPAFTRPTDESMYPILQRIHTDPVPDLRVRGVPSAVADVIETAMAKDPADRPGSALEFGRLLQDAQAQCCQAPTSMLLGLDDERRRVIKGETVVVDESRVEVDAAPISVNAPRPPEVPTQKQQVAVAPEGLRLRRVAFLAAIGIVMAAAILVVAFTRGGGDSDGGLVDGARVDPVEPIELSLGLAEVQTFTFEGRAGQVAGVEMRASADDADPMVSIFGPDGGQLAGDDDLGRGFGETDAFALFLMPEDGLYTIEAIDRSDTDTTMTLELTLDSAPLLVVPVMLEGALTVDEFDRDFYVLQADAGDVFTVLMSAVLPGLDPDVTVLGPVNQLTDDDDSGGGIDGLDARVVFTAPVSGAYRIVAEHNDTTGGPYILEINAGDIDG